MSSIDIVSIGEPLIEFTDRKINPRLPARRFMECPPRCYAAPAQRRTMALMSHREPLLVKNGLPIGVQVIGRRFDDVGVLRLSLLLEQLRPMQRPWPD